MGRCLCLLFFASCLGPPTVDPPACASCHGTPGNAAPPVALGGSEDGPVVGAHQAHLEPSQSVAVACTACHLVPEALDDPGHVDTPLPAEVIWGSIAIEQDAAEPFDAETQTCVVYCHGAAFADPPAAPPGWNDGADAAVCNACHGFPPAAPHPASEGCGDCHPALSEGVHVDGTVQL